MIKIVDGVRFVYEAGDADTDASWSMDGSGRYHVQVLAGATYGGRSVYGPTYYDGKTFQSLGDTRTLTGAMRKCVEHKRRSA